MFCPAPFHELHVLDRAYSTCCPAWLSREVRLLHPAETNDPWLVWNHPRIQRLRSAVLAGDFRFCQSCPRLLSGIVGLENAMAPSNATVGMHLQMERGPRVLHLSNDPACNLWCWSCRDRRLMARVDSPREQIQAAIVREFFPMLGLLVISGSGDPFYSRQHRGLLTSLDGSDFPDLRVELFTNGLLLPAYWPRLEKIHANVDRIKISIDAATPETYHRLRRGGDWLQLLTALDFAAKLQPELWLCFCAQSGNIAELPAFVDLARRYRATRVVVNPLLKRWQSPGLYRRRAIARPDHPDHQRFLEMTAQIRDDPIVDLSAVHPARLANLKGE